MPLREYAAKNICTREHASVQWTVLFHDEFEPEFDALDLDVQDELLAQAKWIERFGPEAGRPRVDTLKGSNFANMKELIFEAADGVWRVAFAFDPQRRAILLVAGDKSGVSQGKFYKRLINKADHRYGKHLRSINQLKKGNQR